MDKQREEFEKWYFNENYKGTTACKLKVFEVLSGLVGVESPYNGTYLNHNVQVSWKAWQQAQKVAVPDGGVNLNKFDLLRKMHNIRDLNNGDYYSDEIEENICAVEAMIEAQEN